MQECVSNCFQNNRKIYKNIMFCGCSAVSVAFQCFASNLSVWIGSLHEFLSRITHSLLLRRLLCSLQLWLG